MPESDRQRRGNLCELRILKREWGGGFWPYKKVRLFRSRGEADSLDFLELRGMRLKPIRRERFHLRKIELHGAREMMGLRFRHQARPSQRGAQKNHRRSGCARNPPERRQRVRCARPGEQCIEARHKKGQPVDSCDGRELKEAQIRRRWITKQIPRKANFRQMRANKLECYPDKWRT